MNCPYICVARIWWQLVVLALAVTVSLREVHGQEKSVLSKHYVLGKIRVFYTTEGKSAVSAVDADVSGVPDQVEDVARQTWAAHRLFCEILKFPDPLKSERNPGVTCIEVYIRDRSELGGNNGLAYETPQRAKPIPEGEPDDRAILFAVGRHVVASRNLSPAHEMFHLIQFGSSFFKRSWYLEGQARWSEHALGKDGLGDVKYPPSGPWPQPEMYLPTLFSMKFDSEFVLWNPIAFVSDPKRIIPVTPELRELATLRYTNGARVLEDAFLTGPDVMREILIELGKMDDLAFAELGYEEWSEENQRSPKTDGYIYQAILDVLRRRSRTVGAFQVSAAPTFGLQDETPEPDQVEPSSAAPKTTADSRAAAVDPKAQALTVGQLPPNGLRLAAQELALVPSDAAQQQAVKLIEEVYGEEHAQAKTSAAKTALANKLLKEAAESTDLTNRYVVLRVARDIATQAGDAETAMRAVEEIGKNFQVDVFQLKGRALSQAKQSASLTKQRKALAEQALALIDEAVARDDFVAAEYLGQLALDSARRAREGGLTKRIVARNEVVTEIAEAYSEAKDAFQTLEENPTHPEANLAVGTYLCFMKGNWNKGIPMLALAKDGQTTKLAVKELEGVTDVAGQVALGDGWWALAETKDGLAKERLRERAAVWYRLAAPKVSGIVKSKVEMRISEIPKERLEQLPAPRLSPPRSSPPPMAAAPFDPQQANGHQRAWAKHLGIPVETTNSIGMKFVLIPPGEFDMGSTQEEVDRLLGEARQDNLPEQYIQRLAGEAPRHRVRITRAFYLGVCEVTQGQWEAVMSANPSTFKGASNPVEKVTWDEATEFCKKLSAKEGKTYRLPTEAEWEYACRAGTTAVYSFGDDESQLGEYAWFDGNSGRTTHSVGQMKPNPFGLYDMYGNVYEWCQDWYGEYSSDAATDPQGPTGGLSRVFRGGSWFRGAGNCRAASRRRFEPRLRGSDRGFRVAVVPPSHSSQEQDQPKPRRSGG